MLLRLPRIPEVGRVFSHSGITAAIKRRALQIIQAGDNSDGHVPFRYFLFPSAVVKHQRIR